MVPSLDVYSSNFIRDKDEITGGSMLFIHDNLSLGEGKIVINYINKLKYNIVYLSDLISE